MLHRFCTALLAATLIGAGAWTSACAEADPQVVIEVSAGQYDRQGVPVFFELPKAIQGGGVLKLTQLETHQPVAAQLELGPPPRLVWMLHDKLPAGQTRRYRLERQPGGGAAGALVRIKLDDAGLLVSASGRPVLRYNHVVVPSADPEKPYYRRSGFIHPLYDPSGQVLTDAMPPDHMHQHGIMFPWVDTTFEGRPVDFWNSHKQQGEIEHKKLEAICAGPVLGSFTALLDHIDRTAPGGPKTVLHETWEVRVYDRSDAFLFDIRSTQTCAGQSALAINKCDYGGMAIRGNYAWFGPGKCEFLTSQRKSRSDGNHTRARWCQMYGQLGGQTSGITIFCHPDNFRFPQPVRLHPSKPYFCFAPPVLGPFGIEPGKPYVSTYRFCASRGKLDPALAELIWNDFAHPAEVRVVE